MKTTIANQITYGQFRSPSNKYLITLGKGTIFISGTNWPMGKRICYRSKEDRGFLNVGDGGRLRYVTATKLERIRRLVLSLFAK